MKYLLPVILLIFGCQYKTPSATENKQVDTFQYKPSPETQAAIDNVYKMIEYMGRRDSFVFKKLEYEAKYYKNDNDKDRVMANRCIDSAIN
jgi:hypothetical protein